MLEALIKLYPNSVVIQVIITSSYFNKMLILEFYQIELKKSDSCDLTQQKRKNSNINYKKHTN